MVTDLARAGDGQATQKRLRIDIPENTAASAPAAKVKRTSVDPPSNFQGGPLDEALWRIDWLLSHLEELPRAPHDDEDLPDGWAKMSSRSKPGKYYYFHSRTGETSWKRPVEQRSAADPT
mmetsp:Transcript_6358/g.10761  ORF Transcript_6358/g.10761 Transcript_6358/m.10761 type:complete len:120 (-) Transcript_6358:21-380(-)